jgi:hypothetical protein
MKKETVILILIFALGNTLWAQNEKKELKNSVSVSYNILPIYLNNPIFMFNYGKQLYKRKSFRVKFESGIGWSAEPFGEAMGILPLVNVQLSLIGSIQKKKHSFLFGLSSMINPFYKSSLINITSGYKYDFTKRLFLSGAINVSTFKLSRESSWGISSYDSNNFFEFYFGYPMLSVGFGVNF